MAEHGALQRMSGSNPALGVREALRWYWYDGHPDRRIWTCIDPFDQFGINGGVEPPLVDDHGRLSNQRVRADPAALEEPNL